MRRRRPKPIDINLPISYRALHLALGSLSKRQKQIITLRLKGLTLYQIAKKLRISICSVHKHNQLARRKLRKIVPIIAQTLQDALKAGGEVKCSSGDQDNT